tara:strand:+ start:232 stop:339 length:108 start_codon:yes stop_codon:yes gene_type:complete
MGGVDEAWFDAMSETLEKAKDAAALHEAREKMKEK